MNKRVFYMLWTLLLSVLSLESCRNDVDLEDLRYPVNETQKRFAEEFTYVFGEVSPEVSWMTVSTNVLEADLSQMKASETYAVQVYSGNPCEDLSYCYLLAEYDGIKGGSKATVEFDYPTGLKKVFVTARASNGLSYTMLADADSSTKQVLKFDSSAPDGIFYDHEPMRYRIAFEGYVGEDVTLDFDYNDIVADLIYTRGSKAELEILAAGCESAVKINYLRTSGSKEHFDEIVDEVHKAMGKDGVYDYYKKRIVYKPLNTDKKTFADVAKATIDLQDDAGKSVLVIAPRIFAEFTHDPDMDGEGDKTNSSIPPKKGCQYPQAILVADPEWQWVDEGIRLSARYAGYPDFYNWMLNPAEYPFWYGGAGWKSANARF